MLNDELNYVLRVTFWSTTSERLFAALSILLNARRELPWTKTSLGAQNVQHFVLNSGRIVQSAVSAAVR